MFAPQLAQAKRTGLREYRTLADLGNSHEVVRRMRPVAVTREMVVQIALATLAPIVPLALTMMPLDELLKKLLGILF